VDLAVIVEGVKFGSLYMEGAILRQEPESRMIGGGRIVFEGTGVGLVDGMVVVGVSAEVGVRERSVEVDDELESEKESNVSESEVFGGEGDGGEERCRATLLA